MPFKFIYYPALCLFLLPEPALAGDTLQARPGRTLSISAGASVLARQDLIYSPFVHSGVSAASLGIKHERVKRSVFYQELLFSMNASQRLEFPDQDGHAGGFGPHEFVFLHFGLGFGKTIRKSGRSALQAGVSVHSDIQVTFYDFHLSDMFGYFLDHSANLWFRTQRIMYERHAISARVSVPVFSWLARPPYLAEDDSFIENISSHRNTKIMVDFIRDGQLTTWNKLQRLNMMLEYRYPVYKWLSVGMDYRLAFINSAQPNTLRSVHQNIHFTVSFQR